jgi:formylglycine-generating enzyme required for sulfatase activity
MPGLAKTSHPDPRPVGQKEPNGWGLYDVHGNVWEWVQDWYDERYYANSPSVDPQGPPSGPSRVVRRGSWHQTATSWRSAFRREYDRDYRSISVGFGGALRGPVTRLHQQRNHGIGDSLDPSVENP